MKVSSDIIEEFSKSRVRVNLTKKLFQSQS